MNYDKHITILEGACNCVTSSHGCHNDVPYDNEFTDIHEDATAIFKHNNVNVCYLTPCV